MKILHTSDWHLGRSLYGRKRYAEFEAFLNWLQTTLDENQVDALLVAGDVFDTSAPSHRAQELYYRFLCRVANSSCRHVVVVAGNHDSPSFLNAPKELLKALAVHVIGHATENLQDELLLLHNAQGQPELLVCAVPYLRDRDMRLVEAGESVADKERKLLEAMQQHYADLSALAVQTRAQLGLNIPIVAMGHLFAAGGLTIEGDGVRELYVGSLAHVHAGIFPATLDYVALGHLHVPQRVNDQEYIRYSGSPIAMGFGEAKQSKSVCLVEFLDAQPTNLTLLHVPVFQELERVAGSWEQIAAQLAVLAAKQSQAWLEIIYSGAEIIADLRERLEQAISGTTMEILRVKNNRIIERVLQQQQSQETLDDLNVHDVFQRCLLAHAVTEQQQSELLQAYQETLLALDESDALAE